MSWLSIADRFRSIVSLPAMLVAYPFSDGIIVGYGEHSENIASMFPRHTLPGDTAIDYVFGLDGALITSEGSNFLAFSMLDRDEPAPLSTLRAWNETFTHSAPKIAKI